MGQGTSTNGRVRRSRRRLGTVAALGALVTLATACPPPVADPGPDPGSCTRQFLDVFTGAPGLRVSNPVISGNGWVVIYQVDDGTGPRMPISMGLAQTSWNLYAWDRASGTTTQVNAPGTTAYEAAVSTDGRYVAYRLATLLGDNSLRYDVALTDRVTGATTTLSPGSTPSVSSSVAISGDGRYVTFVSNDPGLVPGDPDVNTNNDVFAWDRVTATTQRVTDQTVDFGVADSMMGPRSLRLSSDGSTIVLARYEMPDHARVVRINRVTAATTYILDLTQPAPGLFPLMLVGGVDASGLTVSYSTNGLPPGDTNHDVLRFWAGTATQITNPMVPTGSTASDFNSYAGALTADGRYVVFSSMLADPLDTTSPSPALSPTAQGWVWDSVDNSLSAPMPLMPSSTSADGRAIVGTTAPAGIRLASCAEVSQS